MPKRLSFNLWYRGAATTREEKDSCGSPQLPESGRGMRTIEMQGKPSIYCRGRGTNTRGPVSKHWLITELKVRDGEYVGIVMRTERLLPKEKLEFVMLILIVKWQGFFQIT